jgi:NAD(P)H-nitrite reductase large subunit
MTRTEKTKYLIIGNSAGGIGAAEAIREVDKHGALTIISDEPHPVYSRPLISEYLANRCSLERMLFRPADFYEKHNIRTMLGAPVTQLDLDQHYVRAGSQTLSYQKLLLATGGSPIMPRLEGAGVMGIFTFNKLDDAIAINKSLNRYGRKVRAVVIGGGLIGVSATEALVSRGVEVTIVEMKDRILNTIFDEEASALEAEALTEAGVDIITGHTAGKINSYLPGEATGVTLDNSQPLPCEMVIIAIGVQPRRELAASSGLKTNRGIIVDRHMATSSPDVYACGDVAEAYDFVYGENRLTPIWPNAYTGGRIAGRNMAGLPTEYQGGTSMNALKYFGVNIVSAGMVVPPDDSYEVIVRKHGDIYRKVMLQEGRIVGMVFAGDIEKSGIVYNLMKDRVDVSTFKETLVADDFGLASLPEAIWRAKLAIPPSAVAVPVIQPEEALVSE